MEREVLTGNVLDIGNENHGIVYSLYKHYNDDAAIEYVSGKEGSRELVKNSYDTCILLFSLGNIWLRPNKRRLISDIYDYLKEKGVIYIWDMDKPLNKYFNASIEVVLPNNKIKLFKLSEFNLLKDSSKENVLKLLKDYFEIIDFKHSNNIYYIKAQKKGRKPNEGSIGRNKFKVYTQQLGHKVSKSLHKRT